MEKNKVYPLQLWLSSVLVIAPLVFMLFMIISSGFQLEGIQWWLLIAFACGFIGLVLSFPTFMFIQLLFLVIDLNDVPPWVVKVILTGVSIIGVCATFYILEGRFQGLFGMIALYSASIIIASFFYKVEEE